MAPPARARVRAPQLRGRGWLNTGGRPLSLAELRGRCIVLDFWTFCCVNCLHVLDELRPLADRFAEELVVIGVHSPKFEHEGDPAALADAVERYGVHHPVLDDGDLAMWNAYTAKAWPTLVLIDPAGYVVAQMAGEGHADGLAILLEQVIAEHRAAGTLRLGADPYVPPEPPGTALRFPGKVAAVPAWEGGPAGLWVSDTAHHQLVELEPDLVTERRRIGSGARGLKDGAPGAARLQEPQGVLALPPEVAEQVGYHLLVADTVNHALRGVSLRDGHVLTVAGTGRPLRQRVAAGTLAAALEQDLSSPWDLTWWRGEAVVAMAGLHQLWAFDPAAGTVRVLAGSTNEGLVDGDAASCWFAQPSGLAVAGRDLLVADAETSAVRRVTPLPDGGLQVATVVGRGLFDFGHRDGPAGQALLQHPLGMITLADGSIAVADTYNGAVRRIDPCGTVSTIADALAEPSDLLLEEDGLLVVVESAAHRLVRVPVPADARSHQGPARRVARPPTVVRSGRVRLSVPFEPPAGQKLDRRYGDPTRLSVSTSPAQVLAEGGGTGEGLERSLLLRPPAEGGEVVLHVAVQAATCDGDPVTGEVPEFAACHLFQQDWGVPLRFADDAPAELVLDLRGVR